MVEEKPNYLRWEVARLILQIESRDIGIYLSTPPGHTKFITPVVSPQAFLRKEGSPKNNLCRKLTLKVQDIPSFKPIGSGLALFSSSTWELWLNEKGDYEFVLPYDDDPIKITVNQDFSCGEVFGDFSSNKMQGAAVYPLKNLENRLYSAWLGSMGDIILHASGVLKNGMGFCFLGDPGAGKSTLVAALASDPQVTVLGEDQLILRYLDGDFWIFGTPWHLDPNMCSPEGVVLEKMFFLDRNLPPGVVPINPVEGVTRILQTAFIPFYHREWVSNILLHLENLANQVPFFTLSYQLGTDPSDFLQ